MLSQLGSIWHFVRTKITAGQILIGILCIPLLIYVLSEATRTDVLIIDPFTVPKRFEEAGITGDVMANQIGEAITEIGTQAKTTMLKERENLKGVEGEVVPVAVASESLRTSEPNPDIEIPGTKIGLKTLIDITRTIFRIHPKHANGGILVPLNSVAKEAQPVHFVITVHISEGRTRTPGLRSSLNEENLDLLTHQAAEMVLEQVNPYILADYAYSTGDFEKAAQRAEAITKDPRQDTIHRVASLNLWGNALSEEGKHEEAIEKYKKAIELDPKLANAYYNWGAALQAEGRNKEAIEKYRKAIERDPKLGSAYYNWGAALQAEGRNKEAIEKYRKAIALDPKLANAYYNWGAALQVDGSNEEAIEKYKETIALDPIYAPAYYNWGLALTTEGKQKEAIEQYQKATELDPKYAPAYYNWGLALQAEGRNKDAIEQYREAIERDPKLADAYRNWGIALRAEGRNKEASEKFAQASKLSNSQSPK